MKFVKEMSIDFYDLEIIDYLNSEIKVFSDNKSKVMLKVIETYNGAYYKIEHKYKLCQFINNLIVSSTVNADDEFDLNVGIKIATARMKKKILGELNGFYLKINKKINKEFKNIADGQWVQNDRLTKLTGQKYNNLWQANEKLKG